MLARFGPLSKCLVHSICAIAAQFPSCDRWLSRVQLPRMVAGAEITSINDEKVAEELALKYQLASKYTNLLLVHVREEGEKAEGLPKLQKIKQMSAAGWGG